MHNDAIAICFVDSAQTFLFDVKSPDSDAPPAEAAESPTPRKKRTSKGRQRRVFPDFMPREEKKYFLKDEEIPQELRNNPNARRFFKKIGQQIEMIPAQLKVVEQFQEVIALDQRDVTTTIVAAKLMTLTKTCNRLHIDPFAYLQDVYARLPTMSPDELRMLLPDRWLEEHPQHLLPKRVQEAIERAQRARERRHARRRRAA